MYLRAGFFESSIDTGDLLQKFMDQLKDDIAKAGGFANDLPITNNFELKAYLTGIHLIMVSNFDKTLQLSDIKTFYEQIARAIMVKSNDEFLARSDILFSTRIGGRSALVLVHELGHNYLFSIGLFTDSNIADKTMHEFVAHKTSNVLGSFLWASRSKSLAVRFVRYMFYDEKKSMYDINYVNWKEYYRKVMSGKGVEEHVGARGFIDHLESNLKNIKGAFNSAELMNTAIYFVSDINAGNNKFNSEDSQKEMFEKFMRLYAKNMSEKLGRNERKKAEIEKSIIKALGIDIEDKQSAQVSPASAEAEFEMLESFSAWILITAIFFVPFYKRRQFEETAASSTSDSSEKDSDTYSIMDDLKRDGRISGSDAGEISADTDSAVAKDDSQISEKSADVNAAKVDPMNVVKEELGKIVNPAGLAQAIAVKAVLTQEQATALTHDDLILGDNLIVLDNYNLEAMQVLQRQGFRVAYSYADISNQTPKHIDGWKKVMHRVYTRINNDGITEIMFTKTDLETGNEELVQAADDGIQLFEGIKQIIVTNETTAANVINAMKNRYTDSVNAPVKERVLNLDKANVKNSKDIASFKALCRNESKSNDIGVFILSQDQLKNKKFVSSIKELQSERMRFVVKTENYGEVTLNYGEIILDGIMLDVSKESLDRLIGKNGVLEKLKSLKAQSFAAGIDARITVVLSKEVLKSLQQSGTDIWKQYGVLPVVSYKAEYRFKSEVEFDKNANAQDIKEILDKDNVAALSSDNSGIFSLNLYGDKRETLKEELKKAKTAKQQHDKGLNAVLDSKFDYTGSNVSPLFSLINSDRTQQDSETLKSDIEKAVSEAELSQDSVSYINYLLGKGHSHEALGVIRGITMNAARQEYKDILKEKGIDLVVSKFQSEQNGKYQKAILTLIVQLKMSGQLKDAASLKELMQEEVKGERNYMTAKEFLDAAGALIGENIDDILRNNEYEITPIAENDKASVLEIFKLFNVLVQDKFTKAQANKQMQTSMLAVRSILSAA
jgi:hypothetical protein